MNPRLVLQTGIFICSSSAFLFQSRQRPKPSRCINDAEQNQGPLRPAERHEHNEEKQHPDTVKGKNLVEAVQFQAGRIVINHPQEEHQHADHPNPNLIGWGQHEGLEQKIGSQQKEKAQRKQVKGEIIDCFRTVRHGRLVLFCDEKNDHAIWWKIT